MKMNEPIEKQKLMQLATAIKTVETATDEIVDVAHYFGDVDLYDDCLSIFDALESINDRIREALQVELDSMS